LNHLTFSFVKSSSFPCLCSSLRCFHCGKLEIDSLRLWRSADSLSSLILQIDKLRFRKKSVNFPLSIILAKILEFHSTFDRIQKESMPISF
jgi:hypothetical protein